MGYNYRMSNVLAGIGRGQLEVLDLRVSQRRDIFARYAAGFGELRGIEPMPQASDAFSTRWLSCFLIREGDFRISRDELMRRLDADGIESRPVWKPMHLQPLFSECECYGGDVARDLFERGICLPSSSSLTVEDQEYVIECVKAASLSARPSRVMAGDHA
jgi:pyridoxal phosphate-dependent aminotransferase EpsN